MQDHRLAGEIEIVALGFDCHGVHNRLLQVVQIARVAAHDTAQVHRMLLAQTQQEAALGGQAHPVAGLAEVVAVGRYEANPGVAARHRQVAGRTAGMVVAGQQVEMALQLGADLVAGTLTQCPVVGIYQAQRHLLDEGEVEALVHREAYQIDRLVGVHREQIDRHELLDLHVVVLPAARLFDPRERPAVHGIVLRGARVHRGGERVGTLPRRPFPVHLFE